jgi:hypothetical protein
MQVVLQGKSVSLNLNRFGGDVLPPSIKSGYIKSSCIKSR